MTSPVEVRRLLHCNYNCTDLDLLERFYVELFGLRAVMRSGGGGNDGTPFGIYGLTGSNAAFLYDHRGGRRSCALELVQWTEPKTIGSVYPYPWDRGIHALGYSAPDIEAVAARTVELGGTVMRRGDGWLLVRDPEGVAVEVTTADGPAQARYLRIVVSDLDRTLSWWGQLGYAPGSLPTPPPAEVWPGADGHTLVAEQAMVPTDDPSFGIVFTTWDGPPPVGPTYAMPYHQGLYRMAMAVDDVQAAYSTLMDLGIPRQPTYTFAMPGTKLTDGLTILFIRDPDGILVELVDRPRQSS